jgi:hypothetical protein
MTTPEPDPHATIPHGTAEMLREAAATMTDDQLRAWIAVTLSYPRVQQMLAGWDDMADFLALAESAIRGEVDPHEWLDRWIAGAAALEMAQEAEANGEPPFTTLVIRGKTANTTREEPPAQWTPPARLSLAPDTDEP